MTGHRTLMPREGGTLPQPKITRVIAPPQGAPKRLLKAYEEQVAWNARGPKNRHERRAAVAMMPRDLRVQFKASKKPKRGLINEKILRDVYKEVKRFEALSPEEQQAYFNDQSTKPL